MFLLFFFSLKKSSLSRFCAKHSPVLQLLRVMVCLQQVLHLQIHTAPFTMTPQRQNSWSLLDKYSSQALRLCQADLKACSWTWNCTDRWMTARSGIIKAACALLRALDVLTLADIWKYLWDLLKTVPPIIFLNSNWGPEGLEPLPAATESTQKHIWNHLPHYSNK